MLQRFNEYMRTTVKAAFSGPRLPFRFRYQDALTMLWSIQLRWAAMLASATMVDHGSILWVRVRLLLFTVSGYCLHGPTHLLILFAMVYWISTTRHAHSWVGTIAASLAVLAESLLLGSPHYFVRIWVL